DDRGTAGDEVGHEPAGARTDAEAVAGEAGRDMEAGQAVHGGDDGDGVGRRIEGTGPALADRHPLEGGKDGLEVAQPRLQMRTRRLRVQDADALKGRDRVEGPARRLLELLDEAAPEAQPGVPPLRRGERQERPEEADAVGDNVCDRAGAAGDRVAAVGALAEGEAGGERRALRSAAHAVDAHHGGDDLQLRQSQAEVAAEQARPGAAGEHDAAAGNRSALGDGGSDAPGLGFYAAHGALRDDLCAAFAGLPRQGRDGLLRFGATVTRRLDRTDPLSADARQRARDFGRREQAGIELELVHALEPGRATRQLALGRAEIDDAGAAEAEIEAALLQAIPDAHRLEHQRHLAGIAAHLADPAPVAARLLGGQRTLFAER